MKALLMILSILAILSFSFAWASELDKAYDIPITEAIYATDEPDIILKDFSSTNELEEWLARDDTDTRVVLKAGKDGVVKMSGQCEDRAIQLMDRAISDGFKMSFYVMDRLEYKQHYGKWIERGRLHAVNLVIIGNEVSLIDPATDEYWLIAYLD